MRLIYIFMVLMIVSCTPEGRLRRLLNKHPKLVKLDSVQVIDTILTDKVSKDTLFELMLQHDTLIIERENLTIKHYYDKITDKVYLEGTCDVDTIFRYRTKYIRNVVSNSKPFKIKLWHKIALIGLIVLGILYLFKK